MGTLWLLFFYEDCIGAVCRHCLFVEHTQDANVCCAIATGNLDFLNLLYQWLPIKPQIIDACKKRYPNNIQLYLVINSIYLMFNNNQIYVSIPQILLFSWLCWFVWGFCIRSSFSWRIDVTSQCDWSAFLVALYISNTLCHQSNWFTLLSS